MRWRLRSLFALALVLTYSVDIGGQGSPNVIVVTTTMPGIVSDGLCSLTEVIENANTGALNGDCAPGGSGTTIELAPQATYSLLFAHNSADDGTGLPVILRTLTINGHGAIVERSMMPATPEFRIWLVASAATLTLDEITVRGGSANPDGTGLGGGGILNLGTTVLVGSTLSGSHSGTDGGGVSTVQGTLLIQNSTITDNATVNAGGGVRNAGGVVTPLESVVSANQGTGSSNVARGGGLANHAAPTNATMTITGGTVTENSTNGIGGGGIDNAATSNRTAMLTVTNVTISNNVAHGVEHFAGLGGGIQNSFFRGVRSGTARLTVDRSVITGNAAVNGGGISNGFDLSGTYALELTVTASEISGNTADGEGFQVGNGGGIYTLNGSATVANSTVSGNVAAGTGSAISGLGGGIMNAGLSGKAASLAVINSTIASNEAANAGGGLLAAPFNGSATTQLTNSLVTGNTAVTGAECGTLEAIITSNGHNLEDGNTCVFNEPTDLVNSNPLIGVLMSNVGPTRTHALLPGSPAIDAGNDAVCSAMPIGGVDQRGVPRPQGPVCDIGAYEAAWPPTTLALATSFSLSDGTTGTGRFTLLADNRFVDQAGAGGGWFVPQPATLALLYDAAVACRGLWVGRFISATTVVGLQFCLDGSNVRGVWTGTVASAP